MPKLCAFGCKPTGISMHRFPSYEKFPERFKAWVICCGGKLETSSDYEYYKKKLVCDKHFTSQDHNRNQRLNALAVPSLYLSGADMPMSEDLTISDTTNTLDQAALTTPGCSDLPRSANFIQVLHEHNYTSASRHKHISAKNAPQKSPLPRYNCVKVSNMQIQLKRLRSEVCRLKNVMVVVKMFRC